MTKPNQNHKTEGWKNMYHQKLWFQGLIVRRKLHPRRTRGADKNILVNTVKGFLQGGRKRNIVYKTPIKNVHK